MARDYLKLHEIEEVLSGILDEEQHKEAMKFLRQEAEICLCAAREKGECCCGAWDDMENE